MIDLPWWPPFEPMGDEHAGALIAAVRPHAYLALEAATAWLQERSPGPTPRTYPATRAMIAKMWFDDDMRGICIGSVSAPGSSGKPVTVGIAVTRAGELAITVPGEDSVQVWLVVGEQLEAPDGRRVISL
jgi:hypothetical protein